MIDLSLLLLSLAERIQQQMVKGARGWMLHQICSSKKLLSELIHKLHGIQFLGLAFVSRLECEGRLVCGSLGV